MPAAVGKASKVVSGEGGGLLKAHDVRVSVKEEGHEAGELGGGRAATVDGQEPEGSGVGGEGLGRPGAARAGAEEGTPRRWRGRLRGLAEVASKERSRQDARQGLVVKVHVDRPAASEVRERVAAVVKQQKPEGVHVGRSVEVRRQPA